MLFVRLLVLAGCVLFCACSKAPTGAVPSSHAPVTLTIGFPFIAGNTEINGIQQATGLLSFEGLVTIGRDGRPQPRLAQGWKESPDGLQWTFELRPNAFFHDGS